MKILAHSGPHLWLLLWRSYHSVLEVDLASIGQKGFTQLSEFAIMELLLHQGPLPVNTIGRKVLLTSGSITTAVDRLQQRGWIRRRRDPGDARIKRVHLTAEGREHIQNAFSVHATQLEQLFSCLRAEERIELARLLAKVHTTAARSPDAIS